MSKQESRRPLAEQLAIAIAGYQAAMVIPHCARCTKPCCRLDPLVLELNWQQLKLLWQIKESRSAFDRKLAAGQGPVEIRAGHGRYYAHRAVCPAYDAAQRACRVYHQAIKPAGCSDFPVYVDQGYVIADLRCEAVSIDGLSTWIARSVATPLRIVPSPDRDFPFLVSLSVRRRPGR